MKEIFQIFKKIRYKKTILSVLGIFILVLFLSDDGFNEPHIAKITIEDIIIHLKIDNAKTNNRIPIM